MPHYVVLMNWTDQGIRQAADTVQRAEQARQLIAQAGGNLTTVLWTQGRYDVVGIVEAPDDETAAAITLRLGGQGNLRSETLRAFTAEEMRGILGNAG